MSLAPVGRMHLLAPHVSPLQDRRESSRSALSGGPTYPTSLSQGTPVNRRQAVLSRTRFRLQFPSSPTIWPLGTSDSAFCNTDLARKKRQRALSVARRQAGSLPYSRGRAEGAVTVAPALYSGNWATASARLPHGAIPPRAWEFSQQIGAELEEPRVVDERLWSVRSQTCPRRLRRRGHATRQARGGLEACPTRGGWGTAKRASAAASHATHAL
jgi:hypothetical protein